MRAKFINEGFSDITIDNVVNKETLDIWMQDNFKNELFMYSYASEHNLNPEEMDVDEWIDTKEAEEWIEYEIESRFYETINKFRYEIIDGDELSIWRRITVPDNWLEHLEKQGNRLGIYWSWEPNAAEEHWGYDENKRLALIESLIKVDYIDWINTIRLNMDPEAEEEKEIRLFKNTPLQIINLEIDGEKVDITLIKNKIFKA